MTTLVHALALAIMVQFIKTVKTRFSIAESHTDWEISLMSKILNRIEFFNYNINTIYDQYTIHNIRESCA